MTSRLSQPAALAVALLVCGLSGAAASPRTATTNGSNEREGGKSQVITFNEALENVWSRVKETTPGDLVVQLEGTQYKITFSFVTALERRSDHVVELTVNAETGEVTKQIDQGSVLALHGRSAADGWQNFLSARQAYAISVQALAGFRDFDPRGKLTVELKQDVYYVTFPLLVSPETGPLRADYAIQVQVDARTGKVRQMLGAS